MEEYVARCLICDSCIMGPNGVVDFSSISGRPFDYTCILNDEECPIPEIYRKAAKKARREELGLCRIK